MCSAQGDSESPSPRRRPEKEDAVSCSSQHSVHMVYVSNIGSVHSLGRSSAALTRNSSLDTGCIREYSLGGRRKFLPKVSEVLEYSSPAVSSVFRVEWGQSHRCHGVDEARPVVHRHAQRSKVTNYMRWYRVHSRSPPGGTKKFSIRVRYEVEAAHDDQLFSSRHFNKKHEIMLNYARAQARTNGDEKAQFAPKNNKLYSMKITSRNCKPMLSFDVF